jgi:hypothetical protein
MGLGPSGATDLWQHRLFFSGAGKEGEKWEDLFVRPLFYFIPYHVK